MYLLVLKMICWVQNLKDLGVLHESCIVGVLQNLLKSSSLYGEGILKPNPLRKLEVLQQARNNTFQLLKYFLC